MTLLFTVTYTFLKETMLVNIYSYNSLNHFFQLLIRNVNLDVRRDEERIIVAGYQRQISHMKRSIPVYI